MHDFRQNGDDVLRCVTSMTGGGLGPHALSQCQVLLWKLWLTQDPHILPMSCSRIGLDTGRRSTPCGQYSVTRVKISGLWTFMAGEDNCFSSVPPLT